MKNQDRSTKILLGLLVAGVWGLLLKPMVSPPPVVAQSTIPTTRYIFGAQYTTADLLGKSQLHLSYSDRVPRGVRASTTLNSSQVTYLVSSAPAYRLRVHSIVPVQNNGFMVLFER